MKHSEVVRSYFPIRSAGSFRLSLRDVAGYKEPDYKDFVGLSSRLIRGRYGLESVPEKSPVRLSGVCVSLSGGVDSSTTAFLSKVAVDGYNSDYKDKKHVLCVTVKTDPENEYEQRDIETARRFCKDVGIDHKLIDGSDLFNSWIRSQSLNSDNPRDYIDRLVRIRNIMAYQEAVKRNMLTVGTMNRTEYLLKLYTEGQIPSSLAFLEALYKSEVIDLAAFLGLPDYILERDPCGSEVGLNESDIFGVKHKEGLDAVLYLFEQGRTPEEIQQEYGIDYDFLDDVQGHMKNQDWRIFSTSLTRDSVLLRDGVSGV